MSDLLIRGMEMPKSCVGCEWRDAEAGGDCELMIRNPFESYEEQYKHCPFQEISKRYPLLPIPPHGGLVDLKAPFMAQYYDEMTEEWTERMVTVEDALYGCMVDEMPPTIIPAEPCNNLSQPCKKEAQP